ncbi:zinc finger and SCAN domain-containing protein 12 isoform X1 [Frankliniella occidentalis]|uniref:Zinc finger and SCAN domain-containing protein 12 isoform X1 n=1 Tax=Frankliniella occidentalis TaxID=133901 RepID=A0A6J1RW03_FRAOC|nr:zinc finger and SCAN domain-containing protein 12 isoform X1 [Frankliniella occidentalis]XP_052121791.1 zinc finger and SCAN domain-containing protein 12 isoform X1 [Frankliniella occidentalis]
MDQRRDDVTLLGDSVQYGLKHMLPECFVSVKLETYEEASSSDIHQYPATHSAIASEDTPPTGFVTAPVTCKDQSAVNASSSSSKQLCTASSSPQQVIYQIQLASPMMQQTQSGSQSQSTQATPQSSQISHSSDAEVSHVSQAAGRPPPPSHSFPHSHSRSTDIAWLSHSYVDQGSQHFHPHQLPYLPNDASLLTAIPQSEEGTRIVKQNQENQSAASAVSCRTDPPTVSTVSTSETGDNNAFISYVLNPQRGVSTAGIFLFDPSRGLHPPSPHQIQASNSEDGGRNSRSVDEVIRDSSSDSRSISESPKPGENHLVSRGCQTVLTMSQIQDGPLLPDTKIIIADTSTSEVPEPEETKHRVFTDADGEDSEEASSMDSGRLGSNGSDFGEQSAFAHQHPVGDRHGGVSTASGARGGSSQHDSDTSTSRRNNSNEILSGSSDFPFLESDRPYRCDICGRTYSSQQALVNHDRYHRGERPYECETCHKAFATNSHLVTHRRTHTGERPFQCQLCQRCFADRSAFVKHERTHGPNGAIIKRYKCDECGSGFVDSCGLKKHIRIHTGERPYVCNVCEKTFSTSSTFVAHKRIHTGERPYKCESCDKMFITKSHLLTHRRTHTGEKPFTCTVCNRCFADGSSFRRHERLHTGENRYTCMQCGRGFPLESSLEKHKQTHVPTSTFSSYMYENRNDLNCLSTQSCDVQNSRSTRITASQARETSDRNCVDLSREITGDVQVTRNNLCAVASREIDCDNQSGHTAIMVTAREIA